MNIVTQRLFGVVPLAVLILAGCRDNVGPAPDGPLFSKSGEQETPVTTCGTVISTPGRYRVANDLVCVGNGIDIVVSDVTLLLDGHSISGSFDGAGIDVGTGVFGGVGDISIQGPGTVAQFFTNIQFEHVGHSRVVDVTITQGLYGLVINAGYVAGDFQPSSNNHIEGNLIQGNAVGISMNGGNDNQIVANTVTQNDRGIHLFNASGNHVVSNQANNNFSEGILIELPESIGNEVHGNTATGNGVIDLEDRHGECESNNWTGNTFNTAFPSCIE